MISLHHVQPQEFSQTVEKPDLKTFIEWQIERFLISDRDLDGMDIFKLYVRLKNVESKL